MAKKFLYFQPEYVGKFKCDGSKCNARCCRGWDICIDKKTFAQYSKLPDAQEIVRRMKFDSDRGEYVVTLDENNSCPFLNENNLCRLQLEHGEKFLSQTCTSYPRYTRNFGGFFERSLTLTCPVAAKMILFKRSPMKFELIRVTDKVHSRGGKIQSVPVHTAPNFAERMLELQVAMISILQERTLTIDQRLIVLGFFLDRLDEISSAAIDFDELNKLIAAYESEKFWAEQVPLMLRSVTFDAERFIRLMMKISGVIYGNRNLGDEQKFINALVNTFRINPNEKNFAVVPNIAANYERLVDERKIFSEQYASFLENYLVNDLFMNCYPWRFAESIPKNYAMFAITYKVFELLVFAATKNNLAAEDDLLTLVNYFVMRTEHSGKICEDIFAQVKGEDDTFALMETLLEQ